MTLVVMFNKGKMLNFQCFGLGRENFYIYIFLLVSQKSIAQSLFLLGGLGFDSRQIIIFSFFLMSLLFNLFLVVNIKKNTSMKYGQTTMLLVYDIHQCFVHEQHIILLRHGRPLAFSQSKSSPFHICRLL